MATAEIMDCVQQVGETAGEVWHCLSQNGPMSNAKLAKEIEAPRDVVMQAVGWLVAKEKWSSSKAIAAERSNSSDSSLVLKPEEPACRSDRLDSSGD